MTTESNRLREGKPRFKLATRATLAGLVLLTLTAGVLASVRRTPALGSGEYEVEGHVYGMPEAEVFTDDYNGPPVVGDALTHLPYIAPLARGNRPGRRRLPARRP